MTEAVNHPNHYGGDTVYEVIKVLEAWSLDDDAYLFQAIKYIARAGKKDPDKRIEDLEKAEFYVRRRIARLRSADALPEVFSDSWGFTPEKHADSGDQGQRSEPE